MDHCYVQLYSMNDVIVYEEDVKPSVMNENIIRISDNSIARQEEIRPSDKNIICTSDNSIAPQEDIRSSNENIIKKEDSDDYLIELYREQRCLYDPNHQNFKNKQIKEKAWREIAANMQQKNLGKHYSPKFCKMRCTSLRDQYSRGRRNIEKCKSGNADRKFEFFSQLSFLDKFIKRRRSFKKTKNTVQPVRVNSNLYNHYKLKSNDASNDSIAIVSNDEYEDAMDIPQEKDINASTSQDQKILIKRYSNNCYKNLKTLKYKEHRIDQSTSIDKISANIIKLTNLLENVKKMYEVRTPDEVFSQYICTALKLMSEPEKAERKKLIIDALSKSLHNI